MSQLFTELDDTVEWPLLERARRHGRSLEAEVRAILEAAAREERLTTPGLSEEGAPMLQGDEKGFGDLMYERFKDIGLKPDEVHRFNAGVAEINSLWEMGLPDFEADEYEKGHSRA